MYHSIPRVNAVLLMLVFLLHVFVVFYPGRQSKLVQQISNLLPFL